MLEKTMAQPQLFNICDDKLDAILNIVYESPIAITEDMILERLRDRYRWPKFYNTGYPSIERIIQDDGLKDQDFFSLDDNHIISKEVIKYYNDGYTFVLSGVQYLFNDIADITDKLSNRFGIEINSNMYISKGTKVVSYPYHDHDYAVIIKNIEGNSKWIIEGNDYILENQNVFFIDKFKNHCVKEIYDKKISITFNLH